MRKQHLSFGGSRIADARPGAANRPVGPATVPYCANGGAFSLLARAADGV